MLKRILGLLLVLMLLPCAAVSEDALELSDEEITALLWELYQSENADAEFMVLPDDYEEPAAGKTGIYNLLLIGVDNPGDAITGRSDTMLLASLNARTGALRLISFMRDTYVSIPGHGHNKLNAAFSYGGAELLIKTLNKNFGVQVDGYVAVNYALMAELVDEIGGVELTVSEDELPKLNGILEYYNRQRGVEAKKGRLESAGTQVLTGLQTMSYARIRKLDSDFVRVERQQKVILAIYKKLCTLPLFEIPSIITRNISRVDTNVTLARAASLAGMIVGFDEVTFTTLRIPANGAYRSQTISGTYFIVPKLERCRTDIQTFLDE